MVLHGEHTAARNAGSIAMGLGLPVAAALSYLFWRRQKDHRPAVVLRRAAVSVVVLGLPLLWFTFLFAIADAGLNN